MGKKKPVLLFFGLMLSLAIALFSCATSPKIPVGGAEEIPFPKDVNIIPPTSDLPKEIAAFSGKWHGVWREGGGGFEFILVVEEITNQEAKVIYAWGDSYGSWKGKKGFYRIVAKVSPGGPEIEFSSARDSSATFFFKMKKDLNTLEVFRQASYGRLYTIMNRMK